MAVTDYTSEGDKRHCMDLSNIPLSCFRMN
jgi:hypothetical protein